MGPVSPSRKLRSARASAGTTRLVTTASLPVEAGATVTLTGDSADATQIRNVDEDGSRLIIPEISPAPGIESQFVQVDAISILP
jgi:hypothetical protein